MNWHIPEIIAIGGFGILLVTMIVLMVRNNAVEWEITDDFLRSLNPNYQAEDDDEIAAEDEPEDVAA